SVELIAYPDAHTPSDTVLYLPSDGILFLSDLLFVGCHPFLADGDPDNLLHTFGHIASFDALILVPGHEPPGTKNDLDLMKSYVSHCRHTAMNLHATGQQADAISQQVIPEPFMEWEFPNFFPANLRFYDRRLATEQCEG
ncbi:MAG: MBL fold metallo-hydrolase, partial [Candidatus Promineifilaceae bacterium]